MSTFTFSDIAVTTSAIGDRRDIYVGTAAGATVLTTADSGKILVATAGSGTQEWTLPAASNAGLVFTFVCGHASGEILVGVQTGDNVQCKASEGGAVVTTSANSGVKNTAAGNVLGDHMTLVSGGGTTWYMIGQSGAWATR